VGDEVHLTIANEVVDAGPEERRQERSERMGSRAAGSALV
jgi:hypothetical protein